MDSTTKARLERLLIKLLPVIRWVKNYTREDAICDLIAGITLGLTMIPQSIAYASLAGLTPQYGLNSAFIGLLIYALFGTIKEVVIGPSSLMALLTIQATGHLSTDFVILLTFLCGIVQMLMCFCRLGVLVELFSAPVVSGFTSATALIIVVTQLKGLFGVRIHSEEMWDNMVQLYECSPHFKLGDAILGFTCIGCLLALRKLGSVNIPKNVPHRETVKQLFWFLSTGRNALIVTLAALLAYHYKSTDQHLPFVTTRDSETSIPSFTFPPTSTTLNNRTYTFVEMVSELGTSYISIPIISVLANVAIAKAFVNGKVDATQEMLALSLCNVAGSMFQSMPTTGAFSRSALASASRIHTPLAGLYSACMVLMALGFLGEYFHYIPKATLSAVLIAAVVFLVDYKIFRTLWKTSWVDFGAVTFSLLVCLFYNVERGLVLGITIQLIYMLYVSARPKITIEKKKNEAGDFVLVRPQGGFYFPASDFLSSKIKKAGLKEGKGTSPVYVDCSSFAGTDFSAAKGINTLEASFRARGQLLHFYNVHENCYTLWTKTLCSKEYLSTIGSGFTPFGKEIYLLVEEKKDNNEKQVDYSTNKILENESEQNEKLAEEQALLNKSVCDSPV